MDIFDAHSGYILDGELGDHEGYKNPFERARRARTYRPRRSSRQARKCSRCGAWPLWGEDDDGWVLKDRAGVRHQCGGPCLPSEFDLEGEEDV